VGKWRGVEGLVWRPEEAGRCRRCRGLGTGGEGTAPCTTMFNVDTYTEACPAEVSTSGHSRAAHVDASSTLIMPHHVHTTNAYEFQLYKATSSCTPVSDLSWKFLVWPAGGAGCDTAGAGLSVNNLL
jgi:hypothetical protein